MSLNRIDYQRVPGQSRHRFLSGQTILLHGEDHLLLTSIEMASELYRRFYYRDIEAIIVRPARGRTWGNIAFVIAMLPIVSFMVLAAGSSFAPVTYALVVPLAALIILTILHNVHGAHCRTVLQTRVQTANLTSLNRIRHTEKAIAFIAEHAWTAQAEQADPTPTAVGGPQTDTAEEPPDAANGLETPTP